MNFIERLRMSVYGQPLFESNLLMTDTARLHTYIRPLKLVFVDAGSYWVIRASSPNRLNVLHADKKMITELSRCDHIELTAMVLTANIRFFPLQDTNTVATY